MPWYNQGLVSAGETIIGVACGDAQTIAVSTAGTVWGWGSYIDKEGKKFFNPTSTGSVDQCQNETEDVGTFFLSSKIPLHLVTLRECVGVLEDVGMFFHALLTCYFIFTLHSARLCYVVQESVYRSGITSERQETSIIFRYEGSLRRTSEVP